MIIAKSFAFLVLLANLLVSKCQEEYVEINEEHPPNTSTGNPSYSYSYGVNNVHTGDIKTVWEAKEGDTVKGHYSVLEPDGSMRTVKYSSGPNTGFTAIVNNDGEKVDLESEGRGFIENKALRDYGKFYDFSEDEEPHMHSEKKKKRKKHPYDTVFQDYSSKKRPKYPSDLEPSDFSHSITIKHPRDELGLESESQTNIEIETDPKYKSKYKKPKLYTNIVDFDFTKPYKIKPLFSLGSHKDTFEKYQPSNIDYEKYSLSPYGSKLPKYEPTGLDYEKLFTPYMGGKLPKLEDYNFKPSSLKYKYPFVPDIPESYYSDDLPPRPKKKRPHKKPDYHYPSEEQEDYWVPKKKKKTPPRIIDSHDYLPESEEEFDRPRYPSEFEDDDDEDERPHRSPPRRPSKEVVRKIIKKRKPAFNLLDILDI